MAKLIPALSNDPEYLRLAAAEDAAKLSGDKSARVEANRKLCEYTQANYRQKTSPASRAGKRQAAERNVELQYLKASAAKRLTR